MADNARTKAIALLVATFLAGGIVGASVGYSLTRRTMIELRRPTSSTPESERIPTPLESLGLTNDEKTQLRAIARRWRPRATESIDEVRRRVAELENGMFAEMLCALPQEKRDRYLAEMQRSGMPQDVIDKRFALVRANQCPR